MSNLIQYIIQEDPEEERRRQEERDKGSILMSNKSSENKPEQAYKYSPNNLLENDFSSKSTEPKPTNLLLAGLKDKQDPNGTTSTKSSSSGLGLGSANQPSTPTQLAETNPPSHHNNPNIQGNTLNDNKHSNIDYSRYGAGFSKEFIDKMTQDKEFNKILDDYIIPNEGGLVNSPDDRGKLTKFGISKNTYPNEDIKNLTRERANAIIYRDFYAWNGLNKLPYPIRGFVVDYGMPTSPLNAIKTVHKVLGLPSNGNIIGSATMEKLHNFSQQDYEQFLGKYKRSMQEHYNNIVKHDPTQKVHLNGWLNRANRAHLGK